jgi:hypothetical protein
MMVIRGSLIVFQKVIQGELESRDFAKEDALESLASVA